MAGKNYKNEIESVPFYPRLDGIAATLVRFVLDAKDSGLAE
jgi:hypothetical protein